MAGTDPPMTVDALPAVVDLRAVRVACSLSATEVAHVVEVHPTTVLRWERCERLPGPTHVRGLAHAYGVPVPAIAGFFDRVRTPAGPMDGCPGRGLRRLRRMHDLPAAALAEQLGVPVHTVYNWEAGRARVPQDRIAQLAQTFSLHQGALERLLDRWADWQAPTETGVRPLRRLRLRAGLSQAELARLAGIGVTSLKSYEQGAPLSLRGLRGLARALDVPAATVARAAGFDLPTELRPSQWQHDDLPRVLRALRQWSQLTQAELADRCGCSTSAVRAWEQGRLRPGSESRRRLEALYRLDTDQLLTAYPQPGPQVSGQAR